MVKMIAKLVALAPRGVQLLARILAVLLVGKLGMDAEQAQPWAMMAAEAAGALALAGLDWLIHTKFFISLEEHTAILNDAMAGSDVSLQPQSPQSVQSTPSDAASTVGGTPALLVIGVLAVLFGTLVGCSSAELVTTREGMDRGTASIRKEYLAWAQDKAAKGEITADDLRIRQMTLSEYDALVAASRKAHPGTIPTLPTGGTPVPQATTQP